MIAAARPGLASEGRQPSSHQETEIKR